MANDVNEKIEDKLNKVSTKIKKETGKKVSNSNKKSSTKIDEKIKKEVKDNKVSDKLHSGFMKKLLDPENKEPIEMLNENGEPLKFEQIAIVPKDGDIYVILQLIEDEPEKDENGKEKDPEGYLFKVAYDVNIHDYYLQIIEDEVDIEIIFQIYYDLLRDNGIDVDSDEE